MSLFTTYTTVMLAIQSRDFETAIAHFDADIVLHPATGAIPPLKGIEAVSAWLTGDHGLNKNQQWRAINYVESDELLMVEGVDEFDTPDDKHVVLPYAGIYQFKQGKIVAWRDYLHGNLVAEAMAGKPTKDHVLELAQRPAL